MQYTVQLSQIIFTVITVEAPDPESAIDAAYDKVPPLSGAASGWGQSWHRTVAEDIEPESVSDATGPVWETTERWARVEDNPR